MLCFVVQLHEASVSAPTDGRKFFEILHTLCIMAKFLGFLEFLPHTLPTSLSPPGNRVSLIHWYVLIVIVQLIHFLRCTPSLEVKTVSLL